MIKRTKYYTFRDYLRDYFKRRLPSHHVRLSKRSIRFINGFGYVYDINEEQLIYEGKSCTININRSMWPYHSIYSPEYIAKEKYKYV